MFILAERLKGHCMRISTSCGSRGVPLQTLTINYFRGKRLQGDIHKLFAEVVRMLQELNYSLDIQYIDGTKIEAAANKYTFVWRGSVEKNKVKLEEKLKP
jgi:transposase